MNPGEQQYLDLLEELLERGARKSDRTGDRHAVGVRPPDALPLGDSFPLLTTKEAAPEVESSTSCLWFLRGETNVRWCRSAA